MATAPDACYRIQYNSVSGNLCFSYLPEGDELLTAPIDDEATEDEDMSGEAGDNVEDSPGEDEDEDQRMDVEDEDEEIRQPKRIKIANR
jgi:hypothetical protein